ncbi:MAG TPA: hypothetical protein VJH03_15195 [Blastocatellia bacterium]|nr:hypothetical protein [Blastocatellia bacterium]
MRFSLEAVAPYLSLLASVAAGQFLTIHYDCYDRCRGYIIPAMRKLWLLIIVGIFCQSILVFPIHLFLRGLFPQNPIGSVASAVLLGFLATVYRDGPISSAIAKFTSRNPAGLGKEPAQHRIRFMLSMWVLENVRAAIQRLKSQDNRDLQKGAGYFRIPGYSRENEAAELERRLRVWFEQFKAEIANKLKEPRLMCIDLDHFPGNNRFFLLVGHIGRSQLRTLVVAPPPPGLDWDGSERRMRRGAETERHEPDRNFRRARTSDDPLIRDLITQGKFYGVNHVLNASSFNGA